MNSTKKMVERLYRDGNRCSDFQKGVRFLMMMRQVKERMNENSYKLSKKEYSLLETVTGKKYE